MKVGEMNNRFMMKVQRCIFFFKFGLLQTFLYLIRRTH
jgi:hypothetical protein